MRKINCEQCGNFIFEKRYLCSDCFKKLANSFWNLKPSTIEEFFCEDIIPEVILKSMPGYLIKDINETFRCLENELWTATGLMSARILESELKTHVMDDLKADEEVVFNIGDCIKYMEENTTYHEGFLEILNELRELRNEAMYGKYRFSPKLSMDTFRKVLQIITWIYNIILE
ncbi:MAG: hypothetical protein ACTSRG_21765 [Candidatus Helarchaeota archaeon]